MIYYSFSLGGVCVCVCVCVCVLFCLFVIVLYYYNGLCLSMLPVIVVYHFSNVNACVYLIVLA